MNKYFKNFSDLESIDDIGLDEEEKQSILFESSASINAKELAVNWKDFSEHVFFGSGYWCINFALARIFDEENGYPWDGQLSDKNSWKLENTDFENWWFENEYPHQFGYLNIQSGSSVFLYDHENKLDLGRSSYTVEFVIKPLEDQIFNPVFSNYTGSVGTYAYLSSSNTGKTLNFVRKSGSLQDSISLNYDSYISSSHRISLVYNSASSQSLIYVDGELAESSSWATPDFTYSPRNLSLGYLHSSSVAFYFSGAIDDFRVYKSARSSEIIKRNFYKNVHANKSASLVVYYKFNEINELGDPYVVVDYSGNALHGNLNGSAFRESGSLGSWFRTVGDPIFNRSNLRVSASVESWLSSGSIHDQQNQSYIFNIVPSFLIDESEHIDTRLFLLLVAKHYDKLALYAKHTAYTLYSNESGYNVAPDEFLNNLAKNYGFDIGGIYEGSSPVEYFFGENILSSSYSEPLKKIRNSIRRNLVNNLHYLLKTKSTRESIDAALRSLSLSPSVLNINEYGRSNKGIKTTYFPRFEERRVISLDENSYVNVHSASFDDRAKTWELTFLLNSSSVSTTSSLFTIFSGSERILQLRTERENPSSSLGRLVFEYPGDVLFDPYVKSSLVPLYDSIPTTLIAYKGDATSMNYGFYFGRISGNDLEYVKSDMFTTFDVVNIPSSDFAFTGTLGTSGSAIFEGKMLNFKSWDCHITASLPTTSSALIERHIKDFDSLAPMNFLDESDKLSVFYKLNDYTSGPEASLHDYSGNDFTGSAFGLPAIAEEAFPGLFISRLEPSYSYDIAINNDKIDIDPDDDHEVYDVPFVSVDLSPVASLNKEIVKWFGDIEKFDNIIGFPYAKYKYEQEQLNQYVSKFFDEKLNSKTNFKSFMDLIKWFDSNFINLFDQIIPIDLKSSISSFVVEPHLLEHNSVQHIFPYSRKIGPSRQIEALIQVTNPLVGTPGASIDLADPGRFGSPLSSSGEVLDSNFSFPLSSSQGNSFDNYLIKKFTNEQLEKNIANEYGPKFYSNGFYSKTITPEVEVSKSSVLNFGPYSQFGNTRGRNLIYNNFESYNQQAVEMIRETEISKVEILWPYRDSFNGARVLAPQNEDGFFAVFAENERKAGQNAVHTGDLIDIDGYKYMSVDINFEMNAFHFYQNRFSIDVKFMFIDSAGAESSETEFSSSVSFTSSFVTWGLPTPIVKEASLEKEYNFGKRGDWLSGSFPLNNKFNISRNIPNSKFMKTIVCVSLNTPESIFPILRPAGRISVEGTFYKEERSK